MTTLNIGQNNLHLVWGQLIFTYVHMFSLDLVGMKDLIHYINGHKHGCSNALEDFLLAW